MKKLWIWGAIDLPPVCVHNTVKCACARKSGHGDSAADIYCELAINQNESQVNPQHLSCVDVMPQSE